MKRKNTIFLLTAIFLLVLGSVKAADIKVPEPNTPSVTQPKTPEQPGKKEKADSNLPKEDLSKLLNLYLQKNFSSNSSKGNLSLDKLPLNLW